MRRAVDSGAKTRWQREHSGQLCRDRSLFWHLCIPDPGEPKNVDLGPRAITAGAGQRCKVQKRPLRIRSCHSKYSTAENLADDHAAHFRHTNFTLDDPSGRLCWRRLQRFSWWRRRLHSDAVDGVCPGDSHASGGGDRSVRDSHFRQLWNDHPCDQRQRGYSHSTGHAHRCCHRRANRRSRYTIFYLSKNPARLCPVAIDLRGHRDLYAHDRPQTLAMKILICSDGTSSAETAIQLGGSLAGPLKAETTLLGIAETAQDQGPLRETLQEQAQSLQGRGVSVDIMVQSGEPVRQITDQTSNAAYDLVVIGARWTGATGHYWRSEKTYEVIKTVQPPVLVAIGERKQLKRFLVCTGGKEFIEPAVQFTGKLAAAVNASVTLLHVMAEPPAMYADLVRLEENVEQLLESKSELGTNLRRQKKELERLGVSAEVRLRHGNVIDQVFEVAREGDYDLIVTGTSQARGLLRHYIMGDLTRSILNQANVPVLVARAGPPKVGRTLWRAIKGIFGER